MAKQLKDINLYLAYKKLSQKKDKSIRIFVLLVILEVCVFALIASIYITRVMSLKSEIKSLQSEINLKEKKTAEISELIQKKNFYNQKMAVFEYVASSHMRLLQILDELEKITPANVKYESLNLSTDKITCVISADKLETVTQFVYNMQNNGNFKNIVFNSVTGDQNTKMSTITADVVRK